MTTSAAINHNALVLKALDRADYALTAKDIARATGLTLPQVTESLDRLSDINSVASKLGPAGLRYSATVPAAAKTSPPVALEASKRVSARYTSTIPGRTVTHWNCRVKLPRIRLHGPAANAPSMPVQQAAPEDAMPDIRKPTPRTFSDGEKSMIRKLHGYMPAAQLLGVLNDRLVSDQGPRALKYTIEQLHEEIARLSGPTPAATNDFASLRKLLNKAKRDGVLSAINTQVIDDFAVVFSLNERQVMVLKDILLQHEDDDE
jgi:hypothetical protein